MIGATANLLLHLDGTNASTTITDSSASAHTFAVSGNAQLSTAQKKFGSASLLCDGTTDYLTGDGSSAFAFGTGAYTISMWVYQLSAGVQLIYDARGDANSPAIYVDGSGVLTFYWQAGVRASGGTLATSTWTYVGLTGDGSSHHKLYMAGAQVGSTYTDGTAMTCGGAGHPTIGAANDGANGFNGYIDEVLIIKGTALDLTSVPTLPWC